MLCVKLSYIYKFILTLTLTMLNGAGRRDFRLNSPNLKEETTMKTVKLNINCS